VAADVFNSEVLAPLLEEAHPRSGDEAGCNPQVAADLALVYAYGWQEPLFCWVRCPQIATGSVIASFEQRTVGRLPALLLRKSSDIFSYPDLDALDIPREPQPQVPVRPRY
jgi:hypothetical protein